MELKGVDAFALLLTAAFFFLAAAHSPSTATILVDDSVLQQPTEAGSAVAVERGEGKKQVKGEEICCDECSVCLRFLPPMCKCWDVVEDCPSWCENCEDVYGGGKRCLDWKENYCAKTCDYSYLL